MYICPICNRGYKNLDDVAKHSLQCWREHNPNHIAKIAPCRGNTTERQITPEINDFFERMKYVRSNA